jgi:integrase
LSDNGPRRRKGEGSISRMHDHPTCPPVGPDGVRPEHDCQGRYRARIWVVTMTGQKTRPTVYGKTEREVINKLKQLTAKAVTNSVTTGGSITVRDWMQPDPGEGRENYWTEAVDGWKVNTRKGNRSKINQHILPHLGPVRLDKLTPGHLEKMYAAMRKQGLAEATLRQTHMILSRGLKIAARRGKMARNVCELVDPPGTFANKRRALTVDEAWRVLRLCGDNPRFWLALMNGLRQGEVLGLHWDEVELDGLPMPFLRTREALSWDEQGQPVFDTPKSAQSTDRVVFLVPPVVERLRKHKAAELDAGRGRPRDLVFPNPRTGRPMDAKRDWLLWTTLLELAGVPHTQLHAARDTTAKLLEDAGVPDRVVAEILGHAQVRMTHRYQEGNLPARAEAMRALAEYMAQQDGDAGGGSVTALGSR